MIEAVVVSASGIVLAGAVTGGAVYARRVASDVRTIKGILVGVDANESDQGLVGRVDENEQKIEQLRQSPALRTDGGNHGGEN